MEIAATERMIFLESGEFSHACAYWVPLLACPAVLYSRKVISWQLLTLTRAAKRFIFRINPVGTQTEVGFVEMRDSVMVGLGRNYSQSISCHGWSSQPWHPAHLCG